eukprot:jgi/Mesvir1/23821/Mv10629-RA.3
MASASVASVSISRSVAAFSSSRAVPSKANASRSLPAVAAPVRGGRVSLAPSGNAIRSAFWGAQAAAAKPASVCATGSRDALVVRAGTYTQKDINDAQEYLQKMSSFPSNYYSSIKLNLGAVFANTNMTIPSSLASKDFIADFSTLSADRRPPLIIEDALRIQGIRIYRRTERNTPLSKIRGSYGNPLTVENENKVWWLTHCQALRDGDKQNKTFVIDGVEEEYSGLTVLFNEYRDELMYFTKDSLYDSESSISAVPTPDGLKGYWLGRGKGNVYESSWWAMLANPRVRMTWPRVTFSGEDVSFDWVCFDINTGEMTAYGDVVWIRTGDRGGCYKKYEHLYFLRDVYKTFFDMYFGTSSGTTTGSSGSAGGVLKPNAKGIVPAVGPRKGKIAVLIEEHFDPFEFRSYNEYYPRAGYDIEYVSYLWGGDGIRFTSNPTDGRIEEEVFCTTCVTKVKPEDYAGILVIGAYAMDRLRYQVKVWKGKKSDAPGVEFCRQGMAKVRRASGAPWWGAVSAMVCGWRRDIEKWYCCAPCFP